ncbi:hypothetical protein LSAT2_025717 [Lamellibrachia satsuma]|nr:hypothetical protein LSAT2_025717 [Lamellibrachia satsuma]
MKLSVCLEPRHTQRRWPQSLRLVLRAFKPPAATFTVHWIRALQPPLIVGSRSLLGDIDAFVTPCSSIMRKLMRVYERVHGPLMTVYE